MCDRPTVLFLEQQSLPVSFLESLLDAKVVVSGSPFDAIHQLMLKERHISMLVVDLFFLNGSDFFKLVRHIQPQIQLVVMNEASSLDFQKWGFEDIRCMPDDLTKLKSLL